MDAESQVDDCDEVICAGWSEPGGLLRVRPLRRRCRVGFGKFLIISSDILVYRGLQGRVV